MPIKSKTYFKGRICCKCGADLSENDHGRRYYGEDRKKEWDGKSWVCTICNKDIFHNLPEDIAYLNVKWKNNKLYISSDKGKGLIGELVVAKVRNLKVCAIETGRFNYKFDLSIDPDYKLIQAKIRSPIYGNWQVKIGEEHNFDTMIVLCVNKFWNNIDGVYIIPEEELYGKKRIGISSSKRSKWNRFKVDEKKYNEIYHDLTFFLKDDVFFNIEKIKRWLTKRSLKEGN